MERKVLQEFIDIYRSEPALWKMKSCHYNNKTIKNAAYRRLQLKLRELYPEADMDMVKKKINALRTNFRKEQRKVEASRDRGIQTGEPLYVPSLWYYELFHFIADQENDMKNSDVDGSIDVQDMLRVEMDENAYFEGDESDENFDEEFQVSSPDSPKPNDNGPHTSQALSMDGHRPMMMTEHPGFKRKREMGYNSANSSLFENSWYSRQEQQQQQLSVNSYTQASAAAPSLDGHEIFGRYVATKLKKMDKPMQMLSERLISEILYQGQMGCLNRSTCIINSPRVSTKEESSMNSF